MISVRKCKYCGNSFEAVVGKDNNIYCEKCRELIDIYKEDTDYAAMAETYEDNLCTSIVEDDTSTIDDDILKAVLKIPVSINCNSGHRPIVLNDFGKSLK